MTYREIIEERTEYRAVIVADEDPHPPYNDGGFPIIRLSGPWYDRRAEQVEGTSYELHPRITEAAETLDVYDFERYCRIFHGTTGFAYRGPDRSTDYCYIALDTAHWREAMGLDRPVEVEMTEWEAYIDGDVWGVVIERKVVTRSERLTIAGDHLGFEVREEWEEESSCWGYYGDDYAREAAVEGLGHYEPKGEAA